MRTFANKSAKESGAMQTLYFNPAQTKELLTIGGDAALVLMQHYVAIAHQPNPNMEDEVLAAMLCRSTSAIKKVRLQLTNAGWFERIKTTVNKETCIMYAVGKEAVSNYQKGKVAILDKPKSKLLSREEGKAIGLSLGKTEQETEDWLDKYYPMMEKNYLAKKAKEDKHS